MTEQQETPPTRAHWLHLVINNDRSLIISGVLLLLGAVICWIALAKINEISAPPFRVDTNVGISVTGCTEKEFGVANYTYGPEVSLAVYFYNDDSAGPLPSEGCFVDEVVFRSSILLHEYRGEEPGFIEMTGWPSEHFEYLFRRRDDPPEEDTKPAANERYEVGPGEDGDLVELSSVAGVTTAYSYGDDRFGSPHTYTITLSDDWQPEYLQLKFSPPERPKTYFGLSAYKYESTEINQYGRPAYEPITVRGNTRADEIIVTQGNQNEDGEIIGSERGLRYAIHNEDAANRRESGNITYSSILGIGIALLTEAFVILLAVLALSFRRTRQEST